MHTFMSPIPGSPNITDVPDELRERALKRTAVMLRELDQIRRTLELPIEQLPIVIDTYGKHVVALVAEAERADFAKRVEAEREDLAKRTQRLPITMRSETSDYQPMKVVPGKTCVVIVRPQCGSFRPEDFAIHGDRARWVVHDIKIGHRSQFLGKRGPAPGTEFGPGGILEHLRLETCQMAMDLVLEVEYVGPEAAGEVFEVTIVGTVIS